MFSPDLSNLPLSRRQALRSAGAGFGYLAFAGMLSQAAAKAEAQPLAPSPRTSRQRPSGSFFCSCKARSRKSTPSSTSRDFKVTAASPGRAAAF